MRWGCGATRAGLAAGGSQRSWTAAVMTSWMLHVGASVAGIAAQAPEFARTAAAGPTTVADAAFAHPPTATSAAVVQQPRPFGYVLGDTLTQRVLLQSGGNSFNPAALPPIERASFWFTRRSSSIQRGEDGLRWLVIDYQLVNAPQALMTVALPSMTLKSAAGNATLELPEWPISVAPLTPRAAFAKGGLQELRPDHPAPTLPTLPLRRRMELWSSAFALTIVLWLGWWLVRYLRSGANQPFARARREIRRVDDGSAPAWIAMHRAFDRTAGRALQLSTLPALFKKAPHFEAQRAAIERFYAESNLRFFGVAPGVDHAAVAAPDAASPATAGTDTVLRPTVLSLRALAATLRRIERQHER